MTNNDIEQVAKSIWRSGYIKDKNKVRQQAKEDMRRLIAGDFSANLPDKKQKEVFMRMCGFNY